MIIDSMMNLPLLYWASRETGDPRFSKIARQHADTTAKYLVRKDGSTGHIAEFDAESGNIFGYLAGKDTMRILVGAEEMHGLYMDSR